MEKRSYPNILFIIGLITNCLFHYFWLFVPAMIFLIIGIFYRPFSYLGITLFGLDILLSFVEQFKIRRTFLKNSDHPDFQAFQHALSDQENWLKNVHELLNQKIESNEIKPEDENKSKSQDEQDGSYFVNIVRNSNNVGFFLENITGIVGINYITELNQNYEYQANLIIQFKTNDHDFLSIKFYNISAGSLNELGGRIIQLKSLEIIENASYEKKQRFHVKDYENGIIDFYCESYEEIIEKNN